jgi:hypothetical protein
VRSAALASLAAIVGLVAGAYVAHAQLARPRPIPPTVQALMNGYDLAQALNPSD